MAMLETQYAWKIQPDWLVWLPGLVTGLNIACRAVGKTGDAVLTTTPAYPPFLSAPTLAGRELIAVDHPDTGTCHGFDFDKFEQAITSDTHLFVLCNPQNPTGRVFTRRELETIASICERHDLTICSDEIHCGLVLDKDKPHIPIATLNPGIEQRTITLLAPSKTYNLPGMGCSFAVIANPSLRKAFGHVMDGIVPHVNTLGYTAAIAAYRDSDDWLQSLLAYLRYNRDRVEEWVANTEYLTMHHVEATYLAWIDARKLRVADPAAWFEQAGVGLSDGRQFAAPGWVRLNFGCSHALLESALMRMQHALRQHTA